MCCRQTPLFIPYPPNLVESLSTKFSGWFGASRTAVFSTNFCGKASVSHFGLFCAIRRGDADPAPISQKKIYS